MGSDSASAASNCVPLATGARHSARNWARGELAGLPEKYSAETLSTTSGWRGLNSSNIRPAEKVNRPLLAEP